MKKVIVLCLVVGLLLLSGCSQQKKTDSDPLQTSGDTESTVSTESGGDTPETPSLQTFGYTQKDLASVILLQERRTLPSEVPDTFSSGCASL